MLPSPCMHENVMYTTDSVPVTTIMRGLFLSWGSFPIMGGLLLSWGGSFLLVVYVCASVG